MTVQRLSERSVKVQISADELRIFLPDEPQTPDSPQMLRMLSFMLAKAEAVSGIAFSALPVTVELLKNQDGGLAVYFSIQTNPQERHSAKPHTIRLAAQFAEPDMVRQCCLLLKKEQENIRSSVLYKYHANWVLTMKLKQIRASAIHHILLEYGKPFRLSALNRARLAEYGTCIFGQDAVLQAAASEQL